MKFTIKPLREYLDKHKLSQTEFAAILGTTPENVCRWLAGNRIPSGLYLSMICFYTGLSATDFLIPKANVNNKSCDGCSYFPLCWGYTNDES